MISDIIKASLQYPLPHHLLSRFMHFITRLRAGFLSRLAIKIFVRAFKVNLEEAEGGKTGNYSSFNEFFTRQLRPEARDICRKRGTVVSPVDGTVSQFGMITGARIIQAKGRDYDTGALFGGEREIAELFANGSFATLYLAPYNYHRIHAPVAMQLQSTHYVPGRLFSVSPATVRAIPNLFARNERLACVFDTTWGPIGLVMVGALFVGSIETAWAGEVTPPRRACTRHVYYKNEAAAKFRKGDEIGRFNMGSTVILLFQENAVTFTDDLEIAGRVSMGATIAKFRRT